jgi:hypothetical protein
MSVSTTRRSASFRAAAALITAAWLLSACGGGDGGGEAPNNGAPSGQTPPPWGSLTLTDSSGGGNSVARSIDKFTPNRTPIHTQGLGSTLHRVDWIFDNLYDPRATIAEPNPNLSGNVLVVTDAVTPSGPLIGQFSVQLFVNAPDAASPTHSQTFTCGGGAGAYAAFSRGADCDRITWDATTRTVRLNNLPLPSIGATVNGDLSYPVFNIDTNTTGRASAWGACPAATAGEDITPLRWSDTQCLSGSYVGISDTNKACRLTVDASAQTARVEIDGYSQTYRFVLGYEGYERRSDDSGVQKRDWEFFFGTSDNLASAQNSDALVVVMGTERGLRLGDATSSHGLSFAVQHTTAPAGVAGPVDTKWCLAAVAN